MALNTADVRCQNRRRVADYLLKHPDKTQLELQVELGLSDRTVLELLKELKQSDLIEQKQLSKQGVGRPPLAWAIKADARYCIGVRAVQDRLELSMHDLRTEIAAYKTVELGLIEQMPPEEQAELRWAGYRHPYEEGNYYVQVDRAIVREVKKLLEEQQIPAEKVIGIGVAVGGAISGGIWQFGAHMLNLQAEVGWMQSALGIPVQFFRDEQQCGIAEAWYAGIGSSVCLFLDWGVGGMAMNDFYAWNGETGHALSIGHMLLHPGGKPCVCGKRGCFGSYCAARTLLDAGYESLDAFFRALECADEAAQTLWNDYLQDLADGICSLTALFDVPIILSGVMAGYLEPYMPKLEEIIAQRQGTDFPVRLVMGHYREKAAVVGAALQWHRKFMRECV